MLLILEIWLTVKAWRKGWRAWALLPLGIVMAVAFLIGVAVGASGGSVGNAYPVALLVELAGIGALIRLATRAPRQTQLPSMSEAGVPVEVATGGVKV